MDALTLAALVTVVAIALLAWCIWALLQPPIKRQQSHTGSLRQPPAPPARASEPVSAVRPPVPAPPAPVPPSAPATQRAPSQVHSLEADVTYTKADGTTSVRRLTLYSFNSQGEVPYSLNARQEGQQVTKQFLIERIRQLVTVDDPSVAITTVEELRAWIPLRIREKGNASVRQSTRRQPSTSERPPSAPTAPVPSAEVIAAPPPVTPVLTLASLLPAGAKGFAVFDLETTGTAHSSRIVEIALVKLDAQGRITEEWETLVNPAVPIPNAQIHGVSDSHVADAPAFVEIAGLLAAKLDGHVLVAHNLRAFDLPILQAHYAAIPSVEIELGDGVDTMPRSGARKLKDVCAQCGVELTDADAHSAMGDTRALARAFRQGMAHVTAASACVSVTANALLSGPAPTLTRAMVASPQPKSSWEPMPWTLERDQTFAASGPQSTKVDSPIRRGRDALVRLGLTYKKVNSIPKRNPPDFLLATSLDLDNTKMRDARASGLPVVLLSDISTARIGSSVLAWCWHGGNQN
jgi:DNA polymerase III epsilon subunit-like protein